MTTATQRHEEILVLFGSQTGNSEQAAQDFCELLPQKMNIKGISVSTKGMQLDDFLELEKAPWTRLVVIFTSSYGVGQAPLGCYRFRDLADKLVELYGNSTEEKILEGVSFAMCGLGDSKFTTFFENPTVIHRALQLAGAKRVGPLGKADASGEEDQQKVIAQWIQEIWPYIEKVIASDPPLPQVLQRAQKETVKICVEINPEFEPEEEEEEKEGNNSNVVLYVVPVVIAAVAWYCFHRVQKESDE